MTLTEFAQRVLTELEEVWNQDIGVLINAIQIPGSNEERLVAFERALSELVYAGYVELGMETFSPLNYDVLAKEQSVELCSNLGAWLSRNGNDPWKVGSGDRRVGTYPAALITEAGLVEARNILRNRGYQWWRRSK